MDTGTVLYTVDLPVLDIFVFVGVHVCMHMYGLQQKAKDRRYIAALDISLASQLKV